MACPFSAHAHIWGLSLLSSEDGSDLLGYSKLPPIEEAIAAHLCPMLRVKSTIVYPNKLCRTTANITGKAYAALGKAPSVFHLMDIQQVFQEKMHLDEQGLDPDRALQHQ